MNNSSICISFLFSSYSYENAHKFYVFTSLMYHRNGKLIKIFTKVSGSIRSFRNPSAHSLAEFCAAWWDSLCKAGEFQTNKSKQIRSVTVYPNWQTSVTLCSFEKSVSFQMCLRLWKFISIQNARSVCWSSAHDWEISGYPSRVPCVMSH